MSDPTVRLKSNGDYWQACWIDSSGRRKVKSLGSKSKYSKRAAKKLCNQLAADFIIHPGRRDIKRAPILDAYLQHYLKNRNDIEATTLKEHQRTVDLLLKYFDPSLRIDRISRTAARDWRTWIYTINSIRSEATVCKHIRNTKVVFRQALDDDLIPFNPFDRLCGTAPEPDKDWRYVNQEEFDLLLAACPSNHWRLLLSLSRFGGLRRGEALRARWNDVDWGRRRLTVMNPQGRKSTKKASRVIPLEPQLYNLLVDGYDAAASGSIWIAPVSHNNLRRQFHKYIRRAKLQPWNDCFQVLRRNCDTDWSAKYPSSIVASWMGHSPAVSQKYYLQVPDELFDKVAQLDPTRSISRSE